MPKTKTKAKTKAKAKAKAKTKTKTKGKIKINTKSKPKPKTKDNKKTKNMMFQNTAFKRIQNNTLFSERKKQQKNSKTNITISKNKKKPKKQFKNTIYLGATKVTKRKQNKSKNKSKGKGKGKNKGKNKGKGKGKNKSITNNGGYPFLRKVRERHFTHEPISPLENKNVWDRKDFDIGKKIGSGQLGSIYLARDRTSNRLIALKILQKRSFNSHSMRVKHLFEREIEIQKQLKHPNILRMYGNFESRGKIYLVLEYAPRGSLYQNLRKAKRFAERLAANYILSVASAVYYCHRNNIIHRDIKPENILIGRDGQAKLSDFGSSALLKNYQSTNTMGNILLGGSDTTKTKTKSLDASGARSVAQERRNTFIGTLDYIAPEMLKGVGYNHSIDVWALGILLYELIVGSPPFKTWGKIETFRKIQTEKVNIPKVVSLKAKDLLNRLLQKSPQKRLKLKDLFNHPWILQHVSHSQIIYFKKSAGLI